MTLKRTQCHVGPNISSFDDRSPQIQRKEPHKLQSQCLFRCINESLVIVSSDFPVDPFRNFADLFVPVPVLRVKKS